VRICFGSVRDHGIVSGPERGCERRDSFTGPNNLRELGNKAFKISYYYYPDGAKISIVKATLFICFDCVGH
jgi:hypothetical protein